MGKISRWDGFLELESHLTVNNSKTDIALKAICAALFVLTLFAFFTSPNAPSVLETSEKKAAQKCTQEQQDLSGDMQESGVAGETQLYIWSCEPADATTYELNESQSGAKTLADFELLAQEQISHWNLWIGVFTGIGIIALIWTLIETRRMVYVTRIVGQNQLRAFLSIRPKIVPVGTQGFQVFIVDVVNSGQSPARSVAMPTKRKSELSLMALWSRA